MRLDDEQYEFIKGEVIALFERYNIRCIPINGFELATKMGIKLIPYTSLSPKKQSQAMRASPDGFFIESDDGTEMIYYNDERDYRRINMTILHEIAHCVLDHKAGTLSEEAEAKFFAKYALAPPPIVHRIFPYTPEDIEQSFDLSHEASVYAFDYYRKWLRRRAYHCCTDYEIRLINLFLTA